MKNKYYEVLSNFAKFYMNKKGVKRYSRLVKNSSDLEFLKKCMYKERVLNRRNVFRLLECLNISREEAIDIVLEMKEIKNVRY